MCYDLKDLEIYPSLAVYNFQNFHNMAYFIIWSKTQIFLKKNKTKHLDPYRPAPRAVDYPLTGVI